MAEPAKRSARAPESGRKLFMLGAMTVLGAFILLTFAQNWGKATAQRDIKAAEIAARACIADPRAAARHCAYAEKEISAALQELDSSDKHALVQKSRETLARIYIATHKYDAAADIYAKVAAANPQQSEPYRDLALAYSLSGKLRAAQRYATLAVQLAPDNWKAHAFNGHIQARADDPAGALKAYEQALALAPLKEQPALRQAIEHIRTPGQ